MVYGATVSAYMNINVPLHLTELGIEQFQVQSDNNFFVKL